MKYLIFVLTCASLFCHAGQPLRELSGKYTVSSKSYAENEKKTHLYLFLSGSSAKETWDAIDAEPVLNACGINHLEKIAGNLVCSYYKVENTYECSVSINVKNGEADNPIPC